MKYIETDIPGLWILEPKVYPDTRGYFMETYKREDFEKHIGVIDFIQDNESRSTYGVARGLHYQEDDTAQAKLVRVIEGQVFDVAVDVRKNSLTFGKYVAVELSGENKRQFFIPRGFAHGFLVLSEMAVFIYKVDNVYSPSTECTLNFMDPDLNIKWPLNTDKFIFSEKDKSGKLLREI
jgi:dTDP-4-dehydrorhamnose 3,5-epimerase